MQINKSSSQLNDHHHHQPANFISQLSNPNLSTTVSSDVACRCRSMPTEKLHSKYSFNQFNIYDATK